MTRARLLRAGGVAAAGVLSACGAGGNAPAQGATPAAQPVTLQWATDWAKTGGATPVHKKTALGPAYIDGMPPNLKLQLDLLSKTGDQNARAFRIWKHFGEWYAAVNPILSDGFAGGISVRDMATKATAAGNAALDAAGK